MYVKDLPPDAQHLVRTADRIDEKMTSPVEDLPEAKKRIHYSKTQSLFRKLLKDYRGVLRRHSYRVNKGRVSLPEEVEGKTVQDHFKSKVKETEGTESDIRSGMVTSDRYYQRIIPEARAFIDNMREDIQKATRYWYENIGLKPYPEREHEIAKLEKQLRKTLDNLDKAAENTMKIGRLSKTEKYYQLVKTIKSYFTEAMDITGSTEVMAEHLKERNNLQIILETETKTPEPLQTRELKEIEKHLTKQAIIMMEQSAQLYEGVEDTPIRKRKRLLTRPTRQDHNRFWSAYITILLSNAGKIAPPEEIEVEEK